MTDYIKIVNYAIKDTLPTGDPAKIIRGTEFNVEFQAIEDAMATKANAHDGEHTGDTTFENIIVTETVEIGGSTFTGNTTYTGDITYSGDTVTIEGDLIVDGTNINMLIQGTGALNRPYRFWKMYDMGIDDPVNSIRLSEIRLMLTGIEVQQLATLTSSGPIAGLEFWNDGSTVSTALLAGVSVPTTELYWDFGASTPQALTTVEQFYVGGDAGVAGLQQYRIAASDDGVTWTDIALFSGLTPPSGAYESPNYLFGDPGISDAPSDGQQYARQDAAWAVVTGGGGSQFEYDYIVKTVDFTAEAGKWYFIDPTDGYLAITPPANPVQGDVFGISTAVYTSVNGAGISFVSEPFCGAPVFVDIQMDTGYASPAVAAAAYIYIGGVTGWAPLYNYAAPWPYSVE